MEGPALLPGGRYRTGQSGQPGLVLPIELPVSILPLGPILERDLHSFGHRPFAQAFHCGLAHLDRLGDLGIRPLRSFRTRVCLQQDASAGGGAG
jgi:hypothetical protein